MFREVSNPLGSTSSGKLKLVRTFVRFQELIWTVICGEGREELRRRRRTEPQVRGKFGGAYDVPTQITQQIRLAAIGGRQDITAAFFRQGVRGKFA